MQGSNVGAGFVDAIRALSVLVLAALAEADAHGGLTIPALKEKLAVGENLVRRVVTALAFSGQVREVQRYIGRRGPPRRFYVLAKQPEAACAR